MSDSISALLILAVVALLLAAVRFFRTLEPAVLDSLGAPLVAGGICGALMLVDALGRREAAIGLLLTLGLIYVRLSGHETEPVDGILIGAASGWAAALVGVVAGGGGTGCVATRLAAGSVAGFGVTLSGSTPQAIGRRIVLDAVTIAASIGAAIGITSLLHAGIESLRVAIGVAAAIPLLVIAAGFKQWPEVRRELDEEIRLGLLDAEDVRIAAHPLRRFGSGGWHDPAAHRAFVRAATALARRKRQQRGRPDEIARLYQLEIMKLRMLIQEMTRIGRRPAAAGAAPAGEDEAIGSATMARRG